MHGVDDAGLTLGVAENRTRAAVGEGADGEPSFTGLIVKLLEALAVGRRFGDDADLAGIVANLELRGAVA